LHRDVGAFDDLTFGVGYNVGVVCSACFVGLSIAIVIFVISTYFGCGRIDRFTDFFSCVADHFSICAFAWLAGLACLANVCGAIVDLAIAVVVFSVAYFGRGRCRGLAGEGTTPTNAEPILAQPFLGCVFTGFSYICWIVVDLAVAVVVFAVACFRLWGSGFGIARSPFAI
jgi:hypothetical protein